MQGTKTRDEDEKLSMQTTCMVNLGIRDESLGWFYNSLCLCFAVTDVTILAAPGNYKTAQPARAGAGASPQPRPRAVFFISFFPYPYYVGSHQD